MREVWLEARFSLGNEVRMGRTNLSRNSLNFQALRSSDGFWRSTEVIALLKAVIEHGGGAIGIRDFGALDSALAQPQMSF